MANKYTPYEQLKFSDDYMFKSVMIRENICRRVLERILGERVREIKDPIKNRCLICGA